MKIVIIIIILIIAFHIIKKYLKKYKKYLKSPKYLGKRGERIVSRKLGKNVEGVQYVINNLLFLDESGKSCQIDHVLINKNGIWVIETKNYTGCIYGKDNYQDWVQVTYLVYEFYNPVKQNKTHIYYLSKYLNVNNIFQNVVVFLNKADIKNVTSDSVYKVRNLKTIKNARTNISLSSDEMKYYYEKLLELKNNKTISMEDHINNIHKVQNELQEGICPRCGGNLVLRKGQYGQFYGCSNYPKCKFKKNTM